MDAKQIIEQAQHLTDKMYQDAHKDDKTAFHIGVLQSKIRELCIEIQVRDQIIHSLKEVNAKVVQLRKTND